MSHAVKIGTTSAHWIDEAETPEGCVRYDGEILGPGKMIWDDDLQNIRPKTPVEMGEGVPK